MGLPRILVFATLSGISFGIAYSLTGEISGIGVSFVLVDFFAKYLEPGVHTIIVIVSSIMTIFFIYRLSKFFMEIYEHRLSGITTAILGFGGSSIVILTPYANSPLLVLGVGIWIVGILIVLLYRKKK